MKLKNVESHDTTSWQRNLIHKFGHPSLKSKEKLILRLYYYVPVVFILQFNFFQ